MLPAIRLEMKDKVGTGYPWAIIRHLGITKNATSQKLLGASLLGVKLKKGNIFAVARIILFLYLYCSKPLLAML